MLYSITRLCYEAKVYHESTMRVTIWATISKQGRLERKAGMLESFVILAYLVEDPEPISLIVSAATSKK